MKVLQKVFLVSLVASASSFNLSYSLPDTDPWLVPNFIDGTLVWITKAFVKAELGLMALDPYLVEYYLYTPKNPTNAQRIRQDDPSSIQNSNFNASIPTRIILHGYRSSSDAPVCSLIRDAIFNTGRSRNIICIDWSKIAQKTYPTARFVAPSVGEDLSEFVNFLLKNTKMSIDDLDFVGHSLGAHVGGIAAKHLKKQNKTIRLIIGCDPALPLFDYNDCSSRLCHTDAKYVESIQTNGGRLGFLRPIGAGAFYPNGGVSQPGCGIDPIGACSHSKSYMYLAEAIEKNDFPTMKCKNGYLSAVAKRCGNTYSSVKMAAVANIGAKGVFYVPVNAEPPYGKG
ncbi:phospholipase A1-like [Episyrphus balteatus]|uniref:phospholipase A1-like n=1 Tax=Episyrphus balteatus TaxID=286459 RepID=UPI0024864C45|nr:phospholipase A1-like [Episyrphus balteatus]